MKQNEVAIIQNLKECEHVNVFRMLEDAFSLLKLDEKKKSIPDWNPLGEIINPGDIVLIKPNFISHSHKLNPNQWEQVITSGELIEAVIHFVHKALNGKGEIIIADGPQTDSDFDLIKKRLGLEKTVEKYHTSGIKIQLLDLREDRWFTKDGVIYDRVKLKGDPKGYTTVDLGDSSEFFTYNLSGRFYGADYNVEETRSYHSNGIHKYVLCKSVLDADVVINMPKLKTHKKTGVTLSLKNIVGVNGYRNCLPHHTVGTPDENGDEFPTNNISNKIQSRAISLFKSILFIRGSKGGTWFRKVKKIGGEVFGSTQVVIRSGNWYGNDTAWRMVLDLNKILFSFNGSGQRRTKKLKYLTIVDGVVAGEGNGPEAPDPKFSGVIIVGFNPVAVDTVCSTIMGFDYRKIPVVSNAWKIRSFPLVDFLSTDIEIVSNRAEWNGTFINLENVKCMDFIPHFGWKGHIERYL